MFPFLGGHPDVSGPRRNKSSNNEVGGIKVAKKEETRNAGTCLFASKSTFGYFDCTRTPNALLHVYHF